MFKTIAVIWCWLLFCNHALADYVVTDSFGRHKFSEPPKRIVVTDWTILEQILALGIVPVGAPETSDYRQFVRRPELPESVVDIGLRRSPDIDKIRALKPDLIILGTDQKRLSRPFSLISRVMFYQSFSDHYRNNYAKAQERLRQLGELFQRQDTAEALIADTEDNILDLARQLQQTRPITKTVTLVRFQGNDRAIVYGANSLSQTVLNMLGLKNGISIQPEKWGHEIIRIRELQHISGYLIFIEPKSTVAQTLKSKAWQSLPAVQENRYLVIKPVTTYGGILSSVYLAEALVKVLTTPVVE